MKKTLVKKIFITAELELITGLRIGDSKENVEIGGVDNPVMRRKDNNEPYIPGSSLKGKIRCLLEQAKGENAESNSKKVQNSFISDLFGCSDSSTNAGDGNSSRIIVRDAYLTEDWAKKLKESEFTDMPYTEVKWENVINRLKGTAEHPRQMERIPAGAKFDLNFIINIFKFSNENTEIIDDESNLYELFKKGLEVLQDDYLGGSGSRGYGQVKITNIVRTEKLASAYIVPKPETTQSETNV